MDDLLDDSNSNSNDDGDDKSAKLQSMATFLAIRLGRSLVKNNKASTTTPRIDESASKANETVIEPQSTDTELLVTEPTQSVETESEEEIEARPTQPIAPKPSADAEVEVHRLQHEREGDRNVALGDEFTKEALEIPPEDNDDQAVDSTMASAVTVEIDPMQPQQQSIPDVVSRDFGKPLEVTERQTTPLKEKPKKKKKSKRKLKEATEPLVSRSSSLNQTSSSDSDALKAKGSIADTSAVNETDAKSDASSLSKDVTPLEAPKSSNLTQSTETTSDAVLVDTVEDAATPPGNVSAKGDDTNVTASVSSVDAIAALPEDTSASGADDSVQSITEQNATVTAGTDVPKNAPESPLLSSALESNTTSTTTLNEPEPVALSDNSSVASAVSNTSAVDTTQEPAAAEALATNHSKSEPSEKPTNSKASIASNTTTQQLLESNVTTGASDVNGTANTSTTISTGEASSAMTDSVQSSMAQNNSASSTSTTGSAASAVADEHTPDSEAISTEESAIDSTSATATKSSDTKSASAARDEIAQDPMSNAIISVGLNESATPSAELALAELPVRASETITTPDRDPFISTNETTTAEGDKNLAIPTRPLSKAEKSISTTPSSGTTNRTREVLTVNVTNGKQSSTSSFKTSFAPFGVKKQATASGVGMSYLGSIAEPAAIGSAASATDTGNSVTNTAAKETASLPSGNEVVPKKSFSPYGAKPKAASTGTGASYLSLVNSNASSPQEISAGDVLATADSNTTMTVNVTEKDVDDIESPPPQIDATEKKSFAPFGLKPKTVVKGFVPGSSIVTSSLNFPKASSELSDKGDSKDSALGLTKAASEATKDDALSASEPTISAARNGTANDSVSIDAKDPSSETGLEQELVATTPLESHNNPTEAFNNPIVTKADGKDSALGVSQDKTVSIATSRRQVEPVSADLSPEVGALPAKLLTQSTTGSRSRNSGRPSASVLPAASFSPASSSSTSSTPLPISKPHLPVRRLHPLATELVVAKSQLADQRAQADGHKAAIGQLKHEVEVLSGKLDRTLRLAAYLELSSVKTELSGQKSHSESQRMEIEELRYQVAELVSRLAIALDMTESLAVPGVVKPRRRAKVTRKPIIATIDTAPKQARFGPKRYWFTGAGKKNEENQNQTLTGKFLER